LADVAERGSGRDAVTRRLSGEFDLNQAAIREAAQRARAGGGNTDSLWHICQAQVRPRLEALAQLQEAVASWDDLVLPDEETMLLRYLADQVRGRSTVLRHWGFAETITRGSGITAMFAGQSGTGKSLAAEVIAGELGLALYRVDLSGVVSKYIGETERNLRQVFDAADQGGALLLFDEADALFGRRSEVRDSHDRFANIEVNYLLQRMEDYRGVAILTTNQRQAVDHGFLRRLRFVVSFPFPSPRERALLWRRAFPAQTPVDDLDLSRLTRLAATGGMIRNIALNAAFCAAGRQAPVTTALVLEMARVEFRKLQLPVSDADFRATAKAVP
jgi:SpoVK/Ycf46/Vps4 family AAA+-type ATPase